MPWAEITPTTQCLEARPWRRFRRERAHWQPIAWVCADAKSHNHHHPECHTFTAAASGFTEQWQRPHELARAWRPYSDGRPIKQAAPAAAEGSSSDSVTVAQPAELPECESPEPAEEEEEAAHVWDDY